MTATSAPGSVVDGATVSAMALDLDEPLGTLEVARMLDVKPRTVHQWVSRGVIPDPDFPVINGSRAWKRRTILELAGATGHIQNEAADLRALYRRTFRRDAIPHRRGGRLPQPPEPPPAKRSRTKKGRARARAKAKTS